MKRLLLPLVLLALVVGVLAAPGAATPPAESGIVDRFVDPGRALIPDAAAGLLAIVGPEDLDDFCAKELGDGDMLWLEIPAGADVIKILLKDFGGDAFVVPLMPPSVLCAMEPRPDMVAWGTVNLKIVDNDFHFSDTKRKNSFGYSATGHMVGPDGEEYRFNGHVRWLWDKDDDAKTLINSKVQLTPVGKKK